MNYKLFAALTLCVFFSQAAFAEDDLLIADFEQADYGKWEVTGTAFGKSPAAGTLPNQMHVDGFAGKQLVNSFVGGDNSKGTLLSPEFAIQRRYISFRIGGGKNAEKLAVQLLIDGKVVQSATGNNDRDGGSERLEPAFFDCAQLAGKTARIRIVDEATGGWGHINCDQIVQSNTRPPVDLQNAEKKFVADKRFLNIPIKNGAPKRKVSLLLNGRPLVINEMELAPGSPDWWAPMDVSAWQGKELVLQVDRLPESSQALALMQLTAAPLGMDGLYSEKLRGQFHFSPQRGWNNDPNGMVFFNSEYHLFFQHNPYGWGWGNMHWGHAVSKDMVHWEELGDKLLPDEMGPMFSGSAVVDWNNTSGLGEAGKPPLVLLYTAAGNPTVQCLAYSLDGRTFKKYAKNPVVKQITGGNRDPKVIWHEPSKQWIMVLYVELAEQQHTVHFFGSPNLIDWKLLSVFKGGIGSDKYLFECPDFFPLAVNGDAKKQMWVLTAADSNYAVGTFDGTTFKAEHSRWKGHFGRGFYAAQTFSDIPAKDGRRIQMGWFQTGTPGMPFNQSMTIPLELRLLETKDGVRMSFSPVKELEALRAGSSMKQEFTLQEDAANPLASEDAELLELIVEFSPGKANSLNLNIRGQEIGWHAKSGILSVADMQAPAPLMNEKQRLHIFCDRTGLEIFASDGLTYVPYPVNLPADKRGVSISVSGGSMTIHKLEVHQLKSAWKTRK